jgi:hypothetical protein
MSLNCVVSIKIVLHIRLLLQIAGEASFNPTGESIPLVSILVLSQSGLGIEVSSIINRAVNPSSMKRQ